MKKPFQCNSATALFTTQFWAVLLYYLYTYLMADYSSMNSVKFLFFIKYLLFLYFEVDFFLIILLYHSITFTNVIAVNRQEWYIIVKFFT
jgi:hypothetical protein